MTANGPACGNCGGAVKTADVLCPHCGALLAAYASPAGSATVAPTYAPQPVDLTIPEPAKIDIPASVPTPGEEVDHISTAPRPLFDLDVTAQELAEAADSDHDEDVVTITDPEVVVTAAPAFAVPSYARPPADTPPPVAQALNEVAPVKQTLPTRRIDVLQPEDTGNSPVGQTDDYLRKLHKQTGYKPSGKKRSQPVETAPSVTSDRPVPADRGAAREIRERSARKSRSSRNQRKISKTATYIVSLLVFLVFALWFIVLIQLVFGSFNGAVAFIAVIATIALSRWRDLVQMFNSDD